MIKDFISPAVPFFNRFAPLSLDGGVARVEKPLLIPECGSQRPAEQVSSGEYRDFGHKPGNKGVASRRRMLASKKKRRLCARTGKSIAKNRDSDLPKAAGDPYTPDSHVLEDLQESYKKEEELPEMGPSCYTGCVCRMCSPCEECIFHFCEHFEKKPVYPCLDEEKLLRKAHGVLRHLRKFHGIRSNRAIPPGKLTCLTFRSVIREQLPPTLSLVDELTIKTASKIVKHACAHCTFKLDAKVSEYKKGLFTRVEVNGEDLARFKTALGMNVPQGWNKQESPYIPNGHATAFHSRQEGGSWNEEKFSENCTVAAILSSGKPRIVTAYSSFNSEVLSPLHRSLYASLKRKGWLLVGPPTNEKVKNLNGKGPLMSYDYEAATDRIKAEYVRTSVEVLKEKAEGLTEDQVACLDVLAHLRFFGSRHAAHRGQPMGSMMSFPLLCLINKTTVDLALLDLLQAKKISFKEWTSHRCLINGDDLLIKSPTVDHSLYDAAHRRWSAAAGMKVNTEKTMIDMEQGEINSTLFQNGKIKKKTNLSALYMSGNTDDVVGVAYEAASSVAEFRRLVSLNAHLLARQSEKFPSSVPLEYRKELLTLPRVRRALRAQPISKRPAEEGTLPMSEKPEGYDLDKAEECMAISEAVKRARALRLFEAKLEPTTQVCQQEVTENAVPCMRWFLRRDRRPKRELILSCLARYWEEKKKKALWVEECASLAPSSQIVSDDSRIGGMLDTIRAWKSARLPCRPMLPFPDDGEADGHVTEGLLIFA